MPKAEVKYAARASNGRCVYDDAAIARLRFVRRCRDLGFSMEQVKALLSLSLSETTNCGDASRIARLHLDNVRAKIADLQMLETALVQLLTDCADGQAHCPMLLRLFDD